MIKEKTKEILTMKIARIQNQNWTIKCYIKNLTKTLRENFVYYTTLTLISFVNIYIVLQFWFLVNDFNDCWLFYVCLSCLCWFWPVVGYFMFVSSQFCHVLCLCPLCVWWNANFDYGIDFHPLAWGSEYMDY